MQLTYITQDSLTFYMDYRQPRSSDYYTAVVACQPANGHTWLISHMTDLLSIWVAGSHDLQIITQPERLASQRVVTHDWITSHITNFHHTWLTYFLYGLQAATIFRLLHSRSGLPASEWSHMISLMIPMASVVLASSKKSTVYIWGPYCSTLAWAFLSASSTFLMISMLLVPPCTWGKECLLFF